VSQSAPKTLFNEYLAMNEEGKALSRQADRVIGLLYDFYPNYDLRDVTLIISMAAEGVAAERRLLHGQLKRIREKQCTSR